jgi:hypothetical protein
VTPLRFFSDFARNARRPAVFSRCLVIAVTVGTVLTAINLGGVLVRGPVDMVVLIKIVANFLVPFVVSNLGAMSSMPPPGDR